MTHHAKLTVAVLAGSLASAACIMLLANAIGLLILAQVA